MYELQSNQVGGVYEKLNKTKNNITQSELRETDDTLYTCSYKSTKRAAKVGSVLETSALQGPVGTHCVNHGVAFICSFLPSFFLLPVFCV